MRSGQHHPGLIEVGLGVRFDLFARGGGRVACGRRIADRGGEVAHEEDHLVPKVLQLAQFIEHHRMPDANVGSRGVQPQLAASSSPVTLERASFCSNSSSIRNVSVPRRINAIASRISSVTETSCQSFCSLSRSRRMAGRIVEPLRPFTPQHEVFRAPQNPVRTRDLAAPLIQ